MTLEDVKNAIISAERDFLASNGLKPHIVSKIIIDGDDVNIMCDGQGAGDLINYGIPYIYKLEYSIQIYQNLVDWWTNKHGSSGMVLPREYSENYQVYKINVQFATDHNTFNFHFATT